MNYDAWKATEPDDLADAREPEGEEEPHDDFQPCERERAVTKPEIAIPMALLVYGE